MKIKKNLGKPDRALRITAGLILMSIFALTFTEQAYAWGWLGIIGIYMIVAGVTGYCPPYTLLRINTYKGVN